MAWLRPTWNHVPSDDFFLSVAGQRFAHGLYAHAPSNYQWELGGKWKSLHGQGGLQDGCTGSVVFVVRGDGKELWRSKLVKADTLIPFTVNVAGIHQLDLIAEDGGDGAASDWAIWIEPSIGR